MSFGILNNTKLAKKEEATKQCRLWTEEYENEVINILKSINNKIYKNRQYYYIKSSFILVTLAGITKVYKTKDNRITATRNHTVSIIRDLHTACGHKCEKNTYKTVAEQYANITKSLIKYIVH